MDEAQYLADRVAVIAAGRIVAEGPPATLGDRNLARARIRYRLPGGADSAGRAWRRRTPRRLHGDHVRDVVRDLHQLTGWALDNGIALDGLEVTRPSLEDVYLALTGGTRGRRHDHAAADRVQIRYVNKAFWRNPASAFFTFAFPLMFLVIFTSLLGHYTVQIGSRTVNTSTYYVASMASFAVITACFNNIAISGHLPARARRAQAGTRHPAAQRVLPRRPDPARAVRLGAARGDHRRVRPRRLQRRHPDRADPAAVRRRAAGRRGRVLRARARASPR